MNAFILVGKVIEEPEIKETSLGKKYSKLVVKDTRSYKNNKDEYEIDSYEVLFWGNGVENINKNDVVSIKGRLQSHAFEKDNNLYLNVDLIGEKATLYSEIN